MNRKGTSIRHIIIGAMAVLILALAVTVFYFIFTIGKNNDTVKENIDSSIDEQIHEIDSELMNLTAFISDSLVNGDSAFDEFRQVNVHELNVAARSLGTDFSEKRTEFDNGVSFYFWCPAKKIEVHSFSTNSNDYTDGIKIIDYLKSTPLTETGWLDGNKWNGIVVNDSLYLLKCSFNKGRYIFCWIKTDYLFSELTDRVLTDGTVTCLDTDGKPLVGTIPNRNSGYFIFSKSLSKSDISLYITSEQVYNSEELLFPIIIVSILAVLILLFAGYSIFYFEYRIYRPLRDMKSNLAGLTENRKKSGIREINESIDAYADLQKQLEDLKIDMYEKQLQNSKTELQYYQLQIQPHFFVNCFSIMYAMAQKKNYLGIQRLCMKLSSFVRSHFVNSFELIPLQEELNQLKDYLDIQNIRHKTSSAINDNIDEKLLECKIPPLMMQTFVENSIKYSGLKDDSIVIDIDVSEISANGKALLQILLTDNGVGISQEKADKINSREVLYDDKGQHIGINNVQHRLSLIYGDSWFLEVRQCDRHSGTTVEIVIPMQE